MKNNRAITLIALVVTMIILLILAGITVGLSTNGSGLFEKAKLATDEYNNSIEKENFELAKLYNETENLQSSRDDIQSSGNPIGTIISVMKKTAPSGYLVCDGAWYDVNGTYKVLADYILEEFGSYDYFKLTGEETQVNKFKVPDLRGEFLRGTGTNQHTDEGSGENVGVHQSGTIHYGVSAFNSQIRNPGTNVRNPDGTSAATGGTYTTSGVGTDGTVGRYYRSRPTNTSVLYCIKY